MATYIPGHTPDRRRMTRIKRSALLHNNFDDIDRPRIKIADTRDELEQAFSLVYREYLRSDYIKNPNGARICLSIYHILPETAVFIFKSDRVISTLTQIYDSKVFGLPMDSLYKEELNTLRDANRKIVEIAALASARETRGQNFFMYLFRDMYLYAIHKNVNDMCIMVNPKHVEFYKTILLFEEFGPEKYYPNVGAPAVALRLNLDNIRGKLKEAYSSFDPDCDLYSFFHNATNIHIKIHNGNHNPGSKRILDAKTVRYFFIEKTNVLENATSHQKHYIRSIYQGLN